MRTSLLIAAIVCVLATLASGASVSRGLPAAPTMRLRGGGILHKIADSLGGWRLVHAQIANSLHMPFPLEGLCVAVPKLEGARGFLEEISY